MAEKPDDRSLITAFLAGDRAAVRQMDDWIKPVVIHRTWRLGDQREDLLQDCRSRLVSILRTDGFSFRSSLKTFVQATAKHVCLDAVRRHRVRAARAVEGSEREIRLEQYASPDDQPDEAHEALDQRRLCFRVLQGLSPGCRELFRMILVEECSYQDLSEHLGVSMGTVKSRLSRCRDRAVTLRHTLVGGPGGERP